MSAASRLRIVHCCNFHYNRSGDKFDTMDQKVHHGLVENGHYVYPFPVHDISRQLTWTNSKRAGARKANAALVETCVKLRPDLVMLGHSQSVTRETLESIREKVPGIRLAMWFCDWFYSARAFKFAYIGERLDLLDAFFATTAGDKLAAFNRDGCRAAFIPNMVHPAVESARAFALAEHDWDLVFIGTDRRDPERRETLAEIDRQLGGRLRVGIFGSLGRPGVFGAEKDRVLARSKAALNLTRLPEPMRWYSSDRIASLTGNGLLTCTRAEAGLEELYGADALLTYDGNADLIAKLDDSLAGDGWRATAERGWQRSHGTFNAKRVTALMVDHVMDDASTGEAFLERILSP